MTAANALLIDFGSTYTKLRAVDLSGARIIGSGQGPSTVTTDVTVGLTAALDDLASKLGGLPMFRYRLASSSAAGGLRMVTVGLVKELTAEAARRAALGAGAKLVGTFAYRLTRTDMERIETLAPDIVLLSGGTDGGNSEVILHNAALLAASGLVCPIIVAGNRNAGDETAELFSASGKNVRVTDNVMPELNVLNIEPAREAVRQVFIERIVHAKGIDRAQALFDHVLMPTPAAVLDGAKLVAEGTSERQGLGDILVVDVGGATTDVHSVCAGNPTRSGIIQQGLPEPVAKRTVEGDLGMRHNAATIVETAGIAEIAARTKLSKNKVEQLLDRLHTNVEWLPMTVDEEVFDQALAEVAVRTAVLRHAGTVETIYTALGPATVQRGKDLSEVQAVIGTGGPLVHARDPGTILAAALSDGQSPQTLLPAHPRLLIDRAYLLYAVGLLATVDKPSALNLALNNLEVLEEVKHGATTAA
jgi:uncharacterized protein (TIGR01319 family)